MPALQNILHIHQRRRQNATTSMAELKNGHIRKKSKLINIAGNTEEEDYYHCHEILNVTIPCVILAATLRKTNDKGSVMELDNAFFPIWTSYLIVYQGEVTI